MRTCFGEKGWIIKQGAVEVGEWTTLEVDGERLPYSRIMLPTRPKVGLKIEINTSELLIKKKKSCLY